MRLPVVEAMLTVLVFRECPPVRTGDLTTPSAILFLDECPFPLASVESSLLASGILSRAAAALESCMSCDSWLESRALPAPGLMPPSLMGGVKTRSVSLVVLVSCEARLERGCWWCWVEGADRLSGKGRLPARAVCDSGTPTAGATRWSCRVGAVAVGKATRCEGASTVLSGRSLRAEGSGGGLGSRCILP